MIFWFVFSMLLLGLLGSCLLPQAFYEPPHVDHEHTMRTSTCVHLTAGCASSSSLPSEGPGEGSQPDSVL